jgi:RimJ/RimL family protein N-acetyltransferase
MIAPTLTGQSVTLRHHVAADLDGFWAFFQSERAAHVDAPKTRTHMYYGFGSEVGSWSLYGMGGWAIEVDGALAGQVAVTKPPHFPETEIGWIVFDGFEGQGIAHEAARLALDYAWDQIHPPTLVSYIHPDNARSVALALRLGAFLDDDAELPTGETAAETLVFRHTRPS